MFIIANDVDLVRNLLRLLHPDTHLWRYPAHIRNGDNRHWEAYGDVISVKNFGKVQLILKHHYFACLCDFHLNASYFRDFHHCTRWRLDVFKDFFLLDTCLWNANDVTKTLFVTRRQSFLKIHGPEAIFSKLIHTNI